VADRSNGQIFGQQMKEQGKKAVIVGSDGMDSGDFNIQGSYISAFAPDIRGIKGNAAFIKGYGKKFVSNFGPRSNDSLITSKVETRFVEANKFQINHVKVVTERGTVYLLGIVRPEEGNAAAEIARTTSGSPRRPTSALLGASMISAKSSSKWSSWAEPGSGYG
jgi:hypothetical protein